MHVITRQKLSGIRHRCKQVDFQMFFESFNSFSVTVPTVGRYSLAGGRTACWKDCSVKAVQGYS